jgi:hypothetical protein
MEESPEIALLLTRYQAAGPREKDAIAARLTTMVEEPLLGFFRRRCRQGEEVVDLWADVRLRLLNALRNSSPESPMRSFTATAFTIARNLYRDTQRRDNPWRLLKLRVQYLATAKRYRDSFARWTLVEQTLIGLAQQRGSAFRNTPAYAAFCGDNTPYLDSAFPGRSPANDKDVRLPELLLSFLNWIETPLPEHPLVTHLAEMIGIQRIYLTSFEEISLQAQRSADEIFAAPAPEREYLDWEACWDEIGRLSLTLRRILLLSLDCPMLILLTGLPDPVPRLAKALEYSEADLRGWLPYLPLDDETLAHQLSVAKGTLYTARSRARERLRKKFWTPCKNLSVSASPSYQEAPA